MDPWEATSEQRSKQYIERSFTFRQIISMKAGSLNKRIFSLRRASNVKFDIDMRDNRYLQIKKTNFQSRGKCMILLTVDDVSNAVMH
jgi:hypothetical protein